MQRANPYGNYEHILDVDNIGWFVDDGAVRSVYMFNIISSALYSSQETKFNLIHVLKRSEACTYISQFRVVDKNSKSVIYVLCIYSLRLYIIMIIIII